VNIVLVATDPVLPEFLRRPLKPLGHTLRVVDSVRGLRDALADMDPRAVILPRRLPDGDVKTTVSWLKQQLSDHEIAAIIVGIDDHDRALARDAAADAYLQIPFSDIEVLEVIGVSTRRHKLILLADDSPMIHKHTVPILSEAGYEVVSAMDGAEALRLARERMPDLVITDIEMPKLDGFEVCSSLKNDDKTAHLPVLICSSLGEAQDLERGFDAGADDYLIKPVIPEEMITRVRALLSGMAPGSREQCILVVDDSPAQRHYVADCLARQGFDIVTAENGRVALERVRERLPALVVSDYEMPEMNGFELVHALKRNPETRNIPVIMLTARESKRDMAQMRAAGASAYLVKPFAQDKCIATVERTLAERQLLNYKLASSVYISDGARRAAEHRAAEGDIGAIRAEEREMSVLFSDIVGFTKMSGDLQPRQVIELLNDYFDILCPIIKDHGGDIDKFIGDAIMAVFADRPGSAPFAERAVRAALAMQSAMNGWSGRDGRRVVTRIGINTGPLVRGDLGSRFVRRDFTVIGDTVNKANRYEANCPPGKVLISQSTRDLLGDLVDAETVTGVNLKGVSEPVTAYVVRKIAEPKPEQTT
jgi:DNA-binding response OmpR family regulator